MGKRSTFDKIERNFYPTPYSAVEPLLPYLWQNTHFVEPCAGDGRLVGHLEKNGHVCTFKSDIEPQAAGIDKLSIFDLTPEMVGDSTVITNPPWERYILHKIINHLRAIGAPAWLLFDADWIHTVQATSYLAYCAKIVSVGRVSWMDNGMSGKDNCAWYLFYPNVVGPPVFHMDRVARSKKGAGMDDLFSDKNSFTN